MQKNNKTKLPDKAAKSRKGAVQGNAAGKRRSAAADRGRYSKITPRPRKEPVKISFLGGLNEVGKNMTCYEYGDSMIIVDCGLAFPESDQPGVDFVIPDFSYIERKIDKIKGVFITHGHEDHIGGLCYLLHDFDIPIYATKLTVGLIRAKMAEHKFTFDPRLNVVATGDTVTVGDFSVEFIHVNHSIPDAVAFAIRTEAGTVVQTGDFKIDSTPIDGGVIDIGRFAEIGEEGVLCLLSDSTNAEQPGFTQSERKVGETFKSLFTKAGGRRIIVATFASNIHRVQQIIDIADEEGRKVALSGRSLESVVNIAAELGYINIPEGTLIPIEAIKKYSDDELVLVTTGSQGEAMSALSRMASGIHRQVAIGSNDYIIISARPIPGNEKAVTNVINSLLRLGAKVIYEQMYDVHVSGHACQEEQKLLISVVKPRYFVPVHGEQKHLRHHAKLAESVGIPPENILIADNGYEVSVSEDGILHSGTVASGKVYVDGYGVGDVGTRVMKERQRLGQDGIIILTAAIDSYTGRLVSGPFIDSKGFVYVREAEDLMREAVELAERVIVAFSPKGGVDAGAVSLKLRDELSRLMYERTKRSPMIVPVILVV